MNINQEILRQIATFLEVSILRNSEFGEFRVANRHGNEKSAYYTPDILDAIRTAVYISAGRDPITTDLPEFIQEVIHL